MGLCFYSTNPWIKWHIHKEWRDDIHFVWCSPVFDPDQLAAEDRGSLIPRTSSPAAIYRDVEVAVSGRTFDKHNPNIKRWRASLKSRVEQWRRAGELAEQDANDLIAILDSDERAVWQPLLYIIPTAAIPTSRIEHVSIGERAGLGPEFRIRDLAGSEFERIRFDAT